MKRTKQNSLQNKPISIQEPEQNLFDKNFQLVKKTFNKQNRFYTLLLIMSGLLFLFFGLSHLGKHVYTDEPVLWYP